MSDVQDILVSEKSEYIYHASMILHPQQVLQDRSVLQEDGRVVVCHFSYCSMWSCVFDSGARVQKVHMIWFNDLNIHFFLGH